MASPKKAYLFLFTDWHLQQGTENEMPENWPPFCNTTPPDKRPLREIFKDIHRQRDKLLPKNFPLEEKMELKPSGSGPEIIDAQGEPPWENVWGVIIDRNAVSSTTNSEKLTSMAVRLHKTLASRRHLIDLFVTPRGNEETPDPLKRYEASFVIYIVENSAEFTFAVAGALVQASQQSHPAVTKFISDRF